MERDGVCAPEVLMKDVRGRVLPRRFYERPAIEVARDLLGKVLSHGAAAGIIVETEAYLGGDDLASHSAAGITNRTRVIFGPGGHAYVYLSYGMHECMNIVAEHAGTPGCVLIRALEPVEGLDLMRARRKKAHTGHELTNGPGKLTQALGITRRHSGIDLTRGDLVVLAPAEPARFRIAVTPRIGITKCADLPLRFFIAGNPFVSGARLSPPAGFRPAPDRSEKRTASHSGARRARSNN
jgi:DNA-3-methyladenine glycosylase